MSTDVGCTSLGTKSKKIIGASLDMLLKLASNNTYIVTTCAHSIVMCSVASVCPSEEVLFRYSICISRMRCCVEYTPCLKTNSAKFFLSELCQISTNFDNFWQKDDKEAKIMRDVLTFHLT